MARIVTRSYENRADAETAVGRLEAAGLPSGDVTTLSNSPDKIESDAAKGAELGGALGSGAGLMPGLAALPIPGVGPVLATGWIFGTLAVGATAGAAAGSLIGAMTGAGISDDEAHFLAETVRRGGAVVSVRTSDSRVPAVEKIMDGVGPIDAALRRDEYEREGWKSFDERAAPYRRPAWSELS
ncbi:MULTISPECIES: hypothetical protein [unclassified Bosea (in: a-proteobacteria)]|uniref:hypothetical protein n=1 Tax=unclassified Bosea (in: a-proteobacteria) TaxID=2653178 RepID=UPI000F74FB4A|nr:MULTISPECIES: hypothetical protein [unclassified Bosea (in: a-proteobacteria)]AZO77305.1 hypothetical protein BLM15_06555 [Bosea sp. Tri-49]RXT22162.1 hypothetical protein B5U98_17210 [Bosea sp. Tri-39]RXT32504.1 hypothetical protein B5U99_28055 [Bosea sp. Tri-54]